MKIVAASTEILAYTPDLEKLIEKAGRTCYKSEDKITDDSACGFIQRIKGFKHDSVLEHGSITVRFIIDRGVSHELVRHRLASFSQESTRYCSYNKNKFGNEITVIDLATGFGISIKNHNAEDEAIYNEWHAAMLDAEQHYIKMLQLGASAQLARSVLPNSLKTEVVMTANPREWQHVFNVRCHRDAHPQIREVMIPLAKEFNAKWPALFGEVND